MKQKHPVHAAEEPVHSGPAPVVADPNEGLSAQQVMERMRGGCLNETVEPPVKTFRQILVSNIFTYFNLVFFILAAALIAVGSWRNLTFMAIVLANIGIGIFQELRAKKTLSKLSILSSPKAAVIRDGVELQIDASKTVRDDIVIFTAGN